MMAAAVVVSMVVIQRLSELLLARKNHARAMENGGIEVGAGHYWLFVVLHSGWLVSLFMESIFLESPIPSWWPFFLAVVIAAQILRYWAIATLGYRWNTRIVVFTHTGTVHSGPYRYLRHPNYVAVALEIFFIPALLGAWYSAVVFSVLNALLLLLIRIPQEERALKNAGRLAADRDAPLATATDDEAKAEISSTVDQADEIRGEPDETRSIDAEGGSINGEKISNLRR